MEIHPDFPVQKKTFGPGWESLDIAPPAAVGALHQALPSPSSVCKTLCSYRVVWEKLLCTLMSFMPPH